jgi:C1A family cysteine protease
MPVPQKSNIDPQAGKMEAGGKGKFATFLASTERGKQDKKFTASTSLPDKTENPFLYEIAVKVNSIDTFDPRETWKDFLTPIQNQGECGACYAYSATAALADRFAILTLGQIKVNLNPLQAAVCMLVSRDADKTNQMTLEEMKTVFETSSSLQSYMDTQMGAACDGDTLYNTGRNLYVFGAVSTDCVPLEGLFDPMTTPPKLTSCYATMGDKLLSCHKDSPEKYKIAYRAKHYNTINFDKQGMEKTIMQAKIELYKYGPIVSGFFVFPSFMSKYDGKTVYKPTQAEREAGAEGGHAIRVIGWGVQDGEEYWLCANSWSPQWGDNGYFKLAMRDKDLKLEENFLCLYPDFHQDIGSYDFYNQKDFFVESIDDRIAKYQMVPSIDPFYFVYADQLDEIADNEQEAVKYLDKPKIKYYNLPNYPKFKAGDPKSWNSLLGSEYTGPRMANAAGRKSSETTIVSAQVGMGILALGIGVVAFLIYRNRQSSGIYRSRY